MEQQPDIQAVIFDLGGVIVRTEDYAPRTQLAARFGKSREELEEIVFNNPLSAKCERGQVGVSEVWEAIRQNLQFPTDEIPNFRKQFFAGDRVDFELVKLIQSLRGRYRTAALSNTWIVDLTGYLAELQITETFDVVISSAACGMAKPEPEIFHKALELVQARPEQAVFVDDNFGNIEAASALGIRTIRFLSSDEARRALSTFVQIP